MLSVITPHSCGLEDTATQEQQRRARARDNDSQKSPPQTQNTQHPATPLSAVSTRRAPSTDRRPRSKSGRHQRAHARKEPTLLIQPYSSAASLPLNLSPLSPCHADPLYHATAARPASLRHPSVTHTHTKSVSPPSHRAPRRQLGSTAPPKKRTSSAQTSPSPPSRCEPYWPRGRPSRAEYIIRRLASF